jgi:CrcB protein
MNHWTWVLLGGGLGALCRFWLSGWVLGVLGPEFPYPIVLVNALGCFLIGLLSGLPEQLASLNPAMRAAVVVGFLGGLTTFSTYLYDSFAFLTKGMVDKALINLLGSVLVCLATFTAGVVLMRGVLQLGGR